MNWQCAIPVFEGLLPEPHNTIVMRLLFLCGYWHALAKLRMHTDSTLAILQDVTKTLGAQFRKFTSETCIHYETKELHREVTARARRTIRVRQTAIRTNPEGSGTEPISDTQSSKPKMLNLNTYKYHSLGDYAETIRQFGTCDSYNTELVRLISYLHSGTYLHVLPSVRES
jgi:hypothetical protein